MKSKSTYTVAELAEHAGLQLHLYSGSANHKITGIATLDKAGSQDLSFYANLFYKPSLKTTQAGAIVLEEKDRIHLEANPNKPKIACLIASNPRLAMAKLANLFLPSEERLDLINRTGFIHPSAVLTESAEIDASANIGPYVVIGNRVKVASGVVIGPGVVISDDVEIGENSRIEARAILHRAVKIGARVFIHAGAVIGSEGFGFAVDQGAWVRIPHLGTVIIGDDCEIGANTTIDRGAIDDTVLDDAVIIDNLVQIGHNVQIGAATAIAGCVAIAGSTKIGKNCLIGGGASIAGHLDIADQVHITATSGVNRSLRQAGSYSSGFPVQPSEKWRKNAGRFQYLDQLAQRVKVLEAKLKNKEELI
ncbi:MAG: UDP-3-O-(3-hydroxymyristoyl)glucosamine N-acyltransferase [Gammaproteobacteria bacterium]